MNESGVVAPGDTCRIALGYRILLPHGFIGIMKERMSVIEQTPFQVLAGTIDSNAMREDAELQKSLVDLQMADIVQDAVRPTRLHPELVLFVHNCGAKPLVYTKGKSIVQLFILPICESQVRILACDEQTSTGVPLRYAPPKQ